MGQGGESRACRWEIFDGKVSSNLSALIQDDKTTYILQTLLLDCAKIRQDERDGVSASPGQDLNIATYSHLLREADSWSGLAR
jgi:hypothetical protein